MATERTYIIPLRKEFSKVPRYRRTNKAVEAVRSFLERHMKSDDVVIGKHLNKELWKHGIRNPPCAIKVTAVKDDEGSVKAELFGFKFEEKKGEVKKKGVGERLKGAIMEKPSEKKEEKVEEKPKEEPKKEEVKKEPEKKPKEEKKEEKPKRPAKKITKKKSAKQ